MAFLKPQSPLSQGNDYFYPLTTADQVIMKGGYRLDQIAGAVEKSTITLYANGWSAEVPYSQSIVVEGLDDNVNMKMLPHFPEDFESKQAMKEETAKISFASRSDSILTFECWDEVPTIDIPVDIEIDITYPGVPDIKINYSVVGGTEEPANPTENMIWVNTDQEITDYKLSKYEPKNPIEGMVWICLGNTSNGYFYTLNINGREFDEVCPISAKQYIGGVWVDVISMIYQNEAWCVWIRTVNIALTSDIWAHGQSGKSGTTGGSIAYTDGKILLSVTKSTSSYGCGSYCYKQEDFTNVVGIDCELYLSEADVDKAQIGIVQNIPVEPIQWITYSEIERVTNVQTIKIDTAEIDFSSGYICVYLSNTTAGLGKACTATITSVKKRSVG